MDINDFIGSTDLQTQGVWIRYGDTDAEFLIASTQTPEARKFSAQQLAKHRRKIRGGLLPAEVNARIVMELLLRFALKGWKNITAKDEEGKIVPFVYTPENARKFLEKSVVARDFIAEEANDGENFGMKLTTFPDETEPEAPGELKSGAQVAP